MEKIIKTESGFCVESDYFNAADTLECGQVFRFSSVPDGYLVLSGDKKCLLKTTDTRTFIITDHPDYFYHYFDLDADYAGVYARLAEFEEFKYLSSGEKSGKKGFDNGETSVVNIKKRCGIHILRQDLFETIISFIISANNNIPRIQGIIERICANFGEKKDDFYAFPTPDRLKAATTDDFRRLGAGYRADYLYHTVQRLADSEILDTLPHEDYQGSLKTLLSLKGVGRKVADCVALFGLHHTCCYPADTWISKADGMDAKSARERGMERYGDLAGYAQQLRFYYTREGSFKTI